MNRKKIGPFFLLLLTGMLVWACQDSAEGITDETAATQKLEEILPGTWEAVSMYVQVNTADGLPDSNFVFRINDGDWMSIFSVSPPHTFFEKDHKYRIEFRDRRDSIMSVSRGMWNVFGDTLMMIEPDQTFQYKVRYDKGLIFFNGLRDWDEDGAEDDNFQEVRRRISIGTE